MRLHFIIVFFSLLGFVLQAQNDSITTLDEVKINGYLNPKPDRYLPKDDDYIYGSSSSTDILRRAFNLYFKETGKGMVSSLRVRGTGASHTAVHWNGIPINSKLNGQTDFNTLLLKSYDAVSLKKNGGSTELGSSAIGGAINLTNNYEFNKGFAGQIYSEFASFQTFNNFITAQYSTQKNVLSVSYESLISKNNYPYLNYDITNENAEVNLYSLNLSDAYTLGKYSYVYFNALINSSDRNTSRNIFSPSNAKLINNNNFYLLGWNYNKNDIKINIKSALTQEKYLYYFNKTNRDHVSDNRNNSFVNQLDVAYKYSKNINFLGGTSVNLMRADGSNIGQPVTNEYAGFIKLNHRINNRLNYTLGTRKTWSNRYEIPLVWSSDIQFRMTKGLYLQGSMSTNFKTPTFNDLYWEPGGNTALKPESSFNTEMSLYWRHKIGFIKLTGFSIDSKNLIQWRPGEQMIWQPINISAALSNGFEFNSKTEFKLTPHLNISLTFDYNYIKAIDKKSHYRLMYVPEHSFNSELLCSYKDWSLGVNEQKSGLVYTTSDESKTLKGYYLTHIVLRKEFFYQRLSANFKVNNLFNTYYEITESRPMPNRNYSISINFKF